MADCEGQITDFTAHLVFFSLEFNLLEDAHLEGLLAASPALARYKPVFDRMRAMRPHQLSAELEQFLHDQGVVGASAWNKLFDETMAGLMFTVDDEAMPLEATLNLLTDPDRARREGRGPSAGRGLRGQRQTLRPHPQHAGEEKEIDRWRKMPSPQHGRHLSNHVEPEVVEALRNAVVAAYPKLSHRYYALKAKWLGLDRLQVWDRNAPLPQESPRLVPWDEAVQTVQGRLPRLRPAHGGNRPALLRQGLDRRGREAGQGTGRLCASDGHHRAPLCHAELPRQTARRDDPGP